MNWRVRLSLSRTVFIDWKGKRGQNLQVMFNIFLWKLFFYSWFCANSQNNNKLVAFKIYQIPAIQMQFYKSPKSPSVVKKWKKYFGALITINIVLIKRQNFITQTTPFNKPPKTKWKREWTFNYLLRNAGFQQKEVRILKIQLIFIFVY